MNRLNKTFTAVSLVLSCCIGVAAFADPAAQAGRAVFDANKNAVLTVKAVISTKMAFMGQSNEDESQAEFTGTVISPDGLMVFSLSSSDPAASMTMLLGGGREGFDVESQVKDLKILLTDGTEVPAEIVLRDQDFDLGFMRPKDAPAEPFQAVDTSNAASPEILDQVVLLNRLGKVANRVYSASLSRIEAIVSRPRTFYIIDQAESNAGLGSPAFTLDGKLVGIVVVRAVPMGGTSPMAMLSSLSSGPPIMPIVIPVEDILDTAENVPHRGEEAEPVEEGDTGTEEAEPDTARGGAAEES